MEKKIKENTNEKQHDHRKLAKELEIFYIDENIGKGFPIWLENGVKLKKVIHDYLYKKEQEYDFIHVETPEIGHLDLYKQSGHYQLYKESMFPVMKFKGEEELVLRPMACPHHIMIYKSKPRSYKELPLRFAENVNQFRFEPSGALLGLERTRAMELTDSHIFLKEDQLEAEIKSVLNLIEKILLKFNIKIEYIELALRDEKDLKKYHGDKKKWDYAENILRNFLLKNKVKFVEKKGEAAFYGPKIDIQIKTALGHLITVSTIQLDFFLPERFSLKYLDKDSKNVMPIIIHRGLIGTYERFIAILLEQTKGNFPFWLAPNQIIILPINNKFHLDYAKEIYLKLLNNNFRVKLDHQNERLGYKIRFYQQQKYKYQIIIGDNEVKNKQISYREYHKKETFTLKIEDFLNKIYKQKD
ncbi:MAG: hypothetical protein HPPSJP_3410 [Candidatus Hepatoplasma scabrum]|nr:MAG: hypothetical protein HPPSJP_3410 [Candidatus Hepatoplasma sp.]